MKTFLKYASPVLASLAFQIVILLNLPVKPGWLGGRIGLFLLVDVLIGFAQWIRFKRDQRLKQIVKRLENA
jgi:hypothetical protein